MPFFTCEFTLPDLIKKLFFVFDIVTFCIVVIKKKSSMYRILFIYISMPHLDEYFLFFQYKNAN